MLFNADVQIEEKNFVTIFVVLMDMSAQCTMRCLGEGKCIVMIIEMIFIMGGRMGGN